MFYARKNRLASSHERLTSAMLRFLSQQLGSANHSANCLEGTT